MGKEDCMESILAVAILRVEIVTRVLVFYAYRAEPVCYIYPSVIHIESTLKFVVLGVCGNELSR